MTFREQIVETIYCTGLAPVFKAIAIFASMGMVGLALVALAGGSR